MDSVTDMKILILFLKAVVTFAADPVLTIEPDCFDYGQSIELKCKTDDLTNNIQFKLGIANKGSCLPLLPPCRTGVAGYERPVQTGGIYTSMTITQYNGTRDDGSWTCVESANTSLPVTLELKLCQTLSSQLNPMSDVSQSSQLTSTEEEITSISSRSNLVGDTETFSSMFPFETETSSFLFQGLSLDHASNTNIAASFINTFTSNIIHVTDSFSLYFPSTEDFSGYRSDSLSKSSFFNYHLISISTKSGLAITANPLNSPSSTMNAMGSSNLIYSPAPCCNYSNSLSSTYGDRSSFLKNADSVIVLKSLFSLSESPAQELQSTPAKSVYQTLVTQKETILTLDYTSLTSSTNTNYIRSSAKPSNENEVVSSDDLNSYSKYAPSNSKSFFNNTFSNKSNVDVGTIKSEIFVKSHSKMGSLENNSIEEVTTFVTPTEKHYLSSSTFVGNSMGTLNISESLTMESSPQKLTNFQISSIEISSVTKSIPAIGYSLDMNSTYESYEITQSRQIQNSIEFFYTSASTTSINSDTSAILYSYTPMSKQDSSKLLTTFPVQMIDSTDVYRKRSNIQTSLLSSIDFKTYISATKVMSASFFDDSLHPASYIQSESLLFFSSAMVPSAPQQSSIHHIRMSSLPFTTSGDFVTVTPGVPSLSIKSKVIAISASAAGCVLFITITVIILFSLKLLPGQKQNQSDTSKEATSHSVYGRSLTETSLNWQSGNDLPVRYYSKNCSTWGISNNNHFSSRYNENWDLI